MYIEIDGNTRKINITQEQRLFGVVQDCNAERKYFKMPRIVGNNIDVTNCIIYIVYQKSDEVGNIYYGEPNMYMCEDVALDETEQNVTFSWELTKDIFDISGYLGFKILVKCTDDDGNVKNVWNTIPEFGIICKSMFGDKIHIQEQNKDIVSKLLQDLKQIKNEMKTKITQPSTAKVGQIFRVQSITEDGNLVLEAVDMPSGGSGGAVDDVQIDGMSIVGENGVANIPIANNTTPGVISPSSNYGTQVIGSTIAPLNWTTYVDNRQNAFMNYRNLDYGVKQAMCDGKGEAWTADEQAAARERIGIGEYELIEKIVVGYSLTTSEPSDWETNYTDYFTNTGTDIEPVYSPVTTEIPPVWEAGVYYLYDPNGAIINRNTLADGSPLNLSALIIDISIPKLDKVQNGMYFYGFGDNEKVFDLYVGNYGNIYRSSGKVLESMHVDGVWRNTIKNKIDSYSVVHSSICYSRNETIKSFRSYIAIISGVTVSIYGIKR